MIANFVSDGPCHGCTRRFTACSDRCPIDAEGGYGYNAWRDEIWKKKTQYKEYVMQHNEDYKRSETYDWNRRKKGSGR